MAMYHAEFMLLAVSTISFLFLLIRKHQAEKTTNMGLLIVGGREALQNISTKLQTKAWYINTQGSEDWVYQEYWFPKHYWVSSLCRDAHEPIIWSDQSSSTQIWQDPDELLSKQLRSHFIFKRSTSQQSEVFWKCWFWCWGDTLTGAVCKSHLLFPHHIQTGAWCCCRWGKLLVWCWFMSRHC